MDEDWDMLKTFFPRDWQQLAVEHKALKGLRQDKDEAKLLRTLLLHVGCGYSLRETVVRAREAQLSDLSDVALLKRLRKSENWLYAMCVSLFRERGVAIADHSEFSVRLFDGTTVKEPGKTGSLWRIHYSVQLPSLSCDFFKLTRTEGKGTGETFRQFSIRKGDFILADRGYCHSGGIDYIRRHKAYVTVRLNPTSVRISGDGKQPFSLLKQLRPIHRPGTIESWNVTVSGELGQPVRGRLCVVRKSKEATEIAQKKLRRRASKHGEALQPETLEYAKYVMLFSTFPKSSFSDAAILEWYRVRWQVELVFKRFKSIAGLGHLPKHDDQSSKAWLYGKLLVALLIEKLIGYASSVSPWGYLLEKSPTSQSMA
jgi:hypothetical protein